MDFINLDNLDKKVYVVGDLNKEVIKILNLSIPEKPILFSKDKILYTQKHISEFNSYDEYKNCIESTADIIKNPNYIATHPNGNSIEYIKLLNQIVLVAVRIKSSNNLWVKSVYPITQAKLDIYVNCGTAIKY